jgi:hypothetical protein
MNKLFALILFLFSGAGCAFAQQWQKVTLPTYSEMLKGFAAPPTQYAETVTWGLEGPLSRESITHDLDAIYKQGIRSVSIEGGYGMKEPYLSPGYFENVKIIVEELKKRGMHLWIIDEGKYPSGFAGGLISRRSPELRMQAIVVSARIHTKDNEPLTLSLPQQTLSAIAVNDADGQSRNVDISSGNLKWPATPGMWTITVVGHRFKTAVTRSANNPTHGKDTIASLIDYLDPAATRKFMEYTHEQYKKYIGSEFGKTVLGFRGDEPEYGFIPWTPQLLTIFKQKKHYDITPYLASFFIQYPTEEQKMAKADFFDVWSDLFRDNFFKIQADWCKANGLEYIVHIDHEDMLMQLARVDGDFFKDMRYVQIPGVDAIWHQIWYDNVADFPKLASSAAHMYGKPRAFSESFAAYRPAPTVNDARWVVNEEMVRGINLFEFMFWPSSATGRLPGKSYLTDSAFTGLSAYANRASWLLANGIPAAGVGLYCPTESMWLGNQMADSTLKTIGKALLEHQVDFDYVDQQGLTKDFNLQNGAFINLSGQKYSTIIFPSVNVLNAVLIDRLKTFVQQGGKVYFLGETPDKIATDNILHASAPANLNWATRSDWRKLSPAFFNGLPHDVRLNKSVEAIKYLHRKWKDADLYFFFNEGNERQQVNATVEGTGNVSYWNPNTATTTNVTGVKTEGRHSIIPLQMDGYEARFIIIQH